MLRITKLLLIITVLFLYVSCDAVLFDQSSPSVTSTYPSNGASDISPDTVFMISFSEEMDRESVERGVSLSKLGDENVKGIFSWEGNTVYFTPINSLHVNPEYFLTVSKSVEDVNGNNLLEDSVVNFTVLGRSAKPSILWINPSDGSNITDDTNRITIGFSTNMDLTSLQDAFSLSPSVTGIVTSISNGRVLLFQPTTPLIFGTVYTVKVSKSAKDVAGNPLDLEYSYSFTVGNDFTAPSLISFATQGGTNIIPGSDIITNISKSSTLIVGFSEIMEESSTIGAFSIEPSIEGILNLSGSNLIFTPNTPLLSEAVYKITIADSAKDIQGNSINAETQFRFKTDAIDSRLLKVLEIRGGDGVPWTDFPTVAWTNTTMTNLSILFSAPVSDSTIDIQFSVDYSEGSFDAPYLGIVSFESNNCLMRFDLKNVNESTRYKIVIEKNESQGNDLYGNPLEEDWIFFFQT